ncbi:probable disease resistance protein At4g27220 [Eucalyptus grandis]|uniref:probable disease resistance protein At4g27220 n=1 Tax=Eucalyptus grandis TaxID=71139 RepID=UPI00192EEB79|nr:probable disease resistance protein At4g27220 [Eucalyptus grandis]XP_039171357.1 probable disease resistance protein At4g27220 [Eucalyptus grandis]XP_039171358.1 probable disease resistance protein At4g27220 [Eucalyptus grandis]XP_039171359.1 probable disease resistance protein At4g27220 [Eucalyptus grandis]XP_039171360.1 probable disease resistance protein At4g27220 [Eucalyptus grandis]
MPRLEDIAWKFVIRQGKKWRCPYCKIEYSGSVTRVKSHFLKQPKEGIVSCTKVPEHISTLMELLQSQVDNKNDIAWKFVDRLGENKWRCHHCRDEFFGDLTGVRGHLLEAPYKGNSICTEVPDHVRTLMRSLLDEVAEGGSRDLAEEQSRDAEPQSRDVLSPAFPPSSQSSERATDMENSNYDLECRFHETSAMPSLAQNILGESMSCLPMTLAGVESFLFDLPERSQCSIQSQMQLNDQQTPAGTLASHYDQLPAADMNRGSPIMNVRRTPQPRRWMEQVVQEDRAVDIANLPSDGATNHSIASPLPNSLLDDGPNELLPILPGYLTLNPQRYQRASLPAQNHQLLDNTFQNESRGSILPGLIASNAPLTNVATTNTARHFNQPDQTFHRQCEGGTGLSPLPLSTDIEPPLPSRPFNGPPIIEPFNSPLQIPEDILNTTGPSTPEVQPALVPPQHQSVPHQAPNNTPSAPQIQRRGTGLIVPSSLPELDMSKGVPLTSHTNTNNNFEKSRALKRKIKQLYSREADIRDELEFAGSLSLKKQKKEVENWLADVEQLRKDFQSIEATSEDCLPSHQQVDTLTQQAEDLMKQGEFPKGLFGARKTKVNKLIERKLVGEAFKRNTTKILEYLVGSQISRLGIYGMGGIGKTTLMKHIHNRLLEKANHDNVLWITVSQDFNTQKLQNDIWEALNLGKLQEKEVGQRAAMLSAVLTEREKLIIILDDVWEDFNLEEVGIPIREDGNKLVLTTRSLEVCRRMQCQEIKIEPLSLEEAEDLFFEELGSKVALNLETIVKSIVKECAGLPLGVITMAASMRGVTNVSEWRDCLEKLKESDAPTEMEKRVLKQLEVSYDRLEKREVQQCFLSCALYPEDKLIDKVELIEFFIDQGLICGLNMNTREKEYDRGFTILSKLENVCLLEDYGENMKMHDLIRDMALHIMSATSIVKAGKWLESIPSEEYWTDALEKVSLMGNEISEIPLNMSPNCPKLSTLLLNGSLLEDAVLPGSFFKQLCGLKVLNLSDCELTELPNSISNLVNLRALLLRGCWKLCYIPYLGKLTSLRKLDVGGCFKLEEVPKGLEMLVNLRYLDLRFSLTVELPKRVLGGLLNLQHLKVHFLDGQDMTKLRALETLECSFEDANDFNKCVRVIEQSNARCYYYLCYYIDKKYHYEEECNITQIEILEREVKIWGWDHAIVSVGGECTGIFILIPQDVQKMTIRCDGITNLSSIGQLEYLEKLYIGNSKNLGVLYGREDEEVIDIFAPALAPLLFSSLRVLTIYDCQKLKYLFGHVFKSILPHLREIRIQTCEEMVGIIAAVTSPPPHPLPFFPSLKKIEVVGCGKMKRAVESEWMPHFPNLRSIEVLGCKKMEEIIGGPPPYSPNEQISLEFLQVRYCNNMRKLLTYEWLPHLRNLQSIEVTSCKGMVELISGEGQGQEESITTSVNNTPSSFQPSSISLPNLECLMLRFLDQLKSIYEAPISCDFMKRLYVHGCPELKRIPLQLRLCEIEELPYIWVEEEEKWKTLVWDHPDAQAILRPYLRKGPHWSPNAIVLNTK